MKINLIKKYSVVSALMFSGIVLFWVSSNRFWGSERWFKLLASDGPGYYAYLPAVVVYHDLSFGFFDKIPSINNNANLKYDYRRKIEGHTVNKYFAGVAFVQLPFYLTGHLVTILTRGAVNGYSRWYLVFFHIGALFYGLLGLFLFWKILKLYGIPDKLSAFLVLSLLFGTNLYHYTVNEPAMSHIFSFSFVNLFVLQALLFFKKGDKKYFLLAMLSLGIVTLIRPINAMVVLSIPFLSGSWLVFKNRMAYLFRSPMILTSGILFYLAIVFVQLLVYKIETGNFIVYAYGGEKLNLLKPHLIDFLFSYRKGFFVYTPVAFLALFGSASLWKTDRFTFITWAGFLFLVIYVLSSWWMWFYGGSFSSRVMVEYLTFFFIPLAWWLSQTKYVKQLKILIIVLILVNMIQTYQYQYGYIHWSAMNKERYWNNFLRIDKVIKHQRDW